MTTELKLAWEKQSYMRYSAPCGPGHVEVRRLASASLGGWSRHWWKVGEVFGRHHHSSSKYPCPEGLTLLEAQVMAERVAADMIAEFNRSPLGQLTLAAVEDQSKRRHHRAAGGRR